MRLIESKAEYIPQEEGLEGIYKQVELAGRTAYHSQDKITPDSAKDFVDRMIKSKHGAALEHGTVYLDYKIIPVNSTQKKKILKDGAYSLLSKNNYEPHTTVALLYYLRFEQSPYSKVVLVEAEDGYPHVFITTNMRVLEDKKLTDTLEHLCSPTRYHEKRYTMRFTCSRAIAQELTRHRVFSFLMESQRYINYSKERHGGELTLIVPDRSAWYGSEESKGEAYWSMLNLLDDIERVYMQAIECGVQPQIARDVLPNATKTELIMTGFAIDWRHVFDLRLFEKTGKVAPDMLDLMQKTQKSMQEAGIWEDIMSKSSKFEQYGSEDNL